MKKSRLYARRHSYPNIPIPIKSDSAPSKIQMTVIQFLTVSPRLDFQDISSFGVFPFPSPSLVPVTSKELLMKYATSILFYYVAIIIALIFLFVNAIWRKDLRGRTQVSPPTTPVYLQKLQKPLSSPLHFHSVSSCTPCSEYVPTRHNVHLL